MQRLPFPEESSLAMSGQRMTKEDMKGLLREMHESGELESFVTEMLHSDPMPRVAVPTMEVGSMNDSSKRRLPAAADDNDGFEVVSEDMQPPVKPRRSELPLDHKKPNLPPGVPSVHAWGKTICELPKVQGREITYETMVTEAETSRTMFEYLQWIYRAGVQSVKVKDMQGYLQAINFDPNQMKSASSVCYEGSTIERKFGQ